VKEDYACRAAEIRRTMYHAPQAVAGRILKFDEGFHGEPWRSRSGVTDEAGFTLRAKEGARGLPSPCKD